MPEARKKPSFSKIIEFFAMKIFNHKTQCRTKFLMFQLSVVSYQLSGLFNRH
jgi:hypothetical protein